MKPEPQVIAPPILRPALPDEDDGGSGSSDVRERESPLAADKPGSGEGRSPIRDDNASVQKNPLPAARAPAPVDPSTVELHALTFMRDAPRVKPAARSSGWPLYVAVALLLLGLIAQVALRQRDQLAASAPALAPLLQALCDPLGCKIRPARRIEALVIDHSSLNRLGTNGYRLQLAVRNRSDIALAMPAIELTLTDIQDRPVVRRVLLPAELGAAATIGAHAEWAGGAGIAVADRIERIVGYKVLAFYP